MNINDPSLNITFKDHISISIQANDTELYFCPDIKTCVDNLINFDKLSKIIVPFITSANVGPSISITVGAFALVIYPHDTFVSWVGKLQNETDAPESFWEFEQELDRYRQLKAFW